MTTERELTLKEWCARLPESHRVNRELAELEAKLHRVCAWAWEPEAHKEQLIDALEDMVHQFAYRNSDDLLITAGLSALECAFDALGISEQTDPDALDGTTLLEAEAERSQEAYRVIWDERTQLGKRCAELEAKLDRVRRLVDELENADDETIPVNALFAWQLAGNKLRNLLGDEDE
jgi:hypothetical protein